MLYGTKSAHGGDIYGGDIALDFSVNTNPFGAPPGVRKALLRAAERIDRYPDPYCRRLIRAFSEAYGVAAEHVICGSGAAELIYSYCEALRPSRALETAPTFSEYSAALRRFGCEPERYRLRPEADFLANEGLLFFAERVQPEVIFLCNPNNPTGRLLPPELAERLLRYCRVSGARLFLDESFIELSDGESLLPQLEKAPGLFILRALTKSHGLAGLRVGFGLSVDHELLRRMSQTVQPWNLSLPAQEAGAAALREPEHVRRAAKLICTERPRLARRLAAMGLRVCPSEASFLLLRSAAGLDTRLRERGVLIRGCADFHGLDAEWYRIAVRTREENDLLTDALRRAI